MKDEDDLLAAAREQIAALPVKPPAAAAAAPESGGGGLPTEMDQVRAALAETAKLQPVPQRDIDVATQTIDLETKAQAAPFDEEIARRRERQLALEAEEARHTKAKTEAKASADKLLNAPLDVESAGEKLGLFGSIAMVLAAGLEGFSGRESRVLGLLDRINNRNFQEAKAKRDARYQALLAEFGDERAAEEAWRLRAEREVEGIADLQFRKSVTTSAGEASKAKAIEALRMRQQARYESTQAAIFGANLKIYQSDAINRARLSAKPAAPSVVPGEAITQKDWEKAADIKIGPNTSVAAAIAELETAKQNYRELQKIFDDYGRIPGASPLSLNHYQLGRLITKDKDAARVRVLMNTMVTQFARASGGSNPSDKDREAAVETLGQTWPQIREFVESRIRATDAVINGAIAGALGPGKTRAFRDALTQASVQGARNPIEETGLPDLPPAAAAQKELPPEGPPPPPRGGFRSRRGGVR